MSGERDAVREELKITEQIGVKVRALAEDMNRRGMWHRNDYGEPSNQSIGEVTRFVVSLLAAHPAPPATAGEDWKAGMEAAAKIADAHDESKGSTIERADTGFMWRSASARTIAAAIRRAAGGGA